MMEVIGNSSLFIPLLSVIMAIGLLSLFVFIIPGLTIIWFGILVFGIVRGLTVWTGIIFGVITLLLISGNIINGAMTITEIRKPRVSWISIAAALVAGIVGTILLPSFAWILVALVGILIVEWLRSKKSEATLRSMAAIIKERRLELVIRFSIGLIMIGLWVLWMVMIR